MNHREPQLLPQESLRAWRYVAMLLLPMLGIVSLNAAGRSGSVNQFTSFVAEGSAPYLLVVGAPPLRFQEFSPPPEVTNVPTTTTPSSSSPDVPLADPSVPDVIVPASEPLAVPSPIEAKEDRPDPLPSPKKTGPAPILPDETRPQIRAEDFLPFFQIPGASRGPAEVNVMVPVSGSAPSPAPLPPSSATYTQSPR